MEEAGEHESGDSESVGARSSPYARDCGAAAARLTSPPPEQELLADSGVRV